MNILFVSSGNSATGVTPIVKKQGKSLQAIGHNVDFYAIKGKGVCGYMKSIRPLRKIIYKHNYDIIHAHYSLSGIACFLTFTVKPEVVSLMGSDVKGNRIMRMIIKAFARFFWSITIVKSDDMKKSLSYKQAHVIPNGVDLDSFYPMEKSIALAHLAWDPEKKHILFPANPQREVKNFALAKKVFEIINRQDCELHWLTNVPNEDVVYHYNAANVIILTSKWEGSPNVIKEAMACNCPIVSTDVGDVKRIIGNTEGCYLTSFEVEDVAEKLKLALDFGKKTNGRDHIKYLDEKIIAEKIIAIYKSILNK